MNRTSKQTATRNVKPGEDFEPWESHNRVPLPVIWIALALGVWGTALLFQDQSSYAVAQGDREADEVAAHDAPEGGEALFLANCSTCHQPNGVGVRLAVPPLQDSEFAKAGPEVVAQIMLRGIDGPIRVKSFTFDGHMPSFAAALDDSEVAQLASYVAGRFGGADAALGRHQVAELRAAHAGSGSWQGGEELAGLVPGLPTQPAMPAIAQAGPDPAISDLIFAGKGDVWSCASCHGGLGQGAENTPRLAGLSQGYIAKQLQDFREGERQNEHMSFVAKGLSDAEIEGLAAYYAGLRVASTAQPALGGDLARGERIALQGDWSLGVPACFSCHGPSGFGVGAEFPALAAQQPAYLASQLAAWAGGHRNNSPLGLMDRISKALPESDRRAVADYLASLPAVPAVEQKAMARIEGGGDEL
ncbi:c-type cytochrome [Paracoccus versutus]|uniref:Cytochrome c553 n=1 Tax=Paracoccus versutus TaxID=34007 RepID=A0A3D9XSE8_PARVE|nr:c-type cytochrome [Paracoccus versutus]REF73374.1 cytochrome c553 [Paracoccus versutus]